MAWCGLLGLVKCMPTFGSKPLVASKPQVIVIKSCVGLFFMKQNLRSTLVLASWAFYNSKEKKNKPFCLKLHLFVGRKVPVVHCTNKKTARPSQYGQCQSE